MQFDPESLLFYTIFQPGISECYQDIVANDRRFVHYTSADTALKIVRNGELWLRNATVMNDFSEITHGLNIIETAFASEAGNRFKAALEDIHQGSLDQVNALYQSWQQDWQFETYIACVSVHRDAEDRSGRLSMWRAYGDTALVIRNTPMMAVTDLLGVYSAPVVYQDEADFAERLDRIAASITKHADQLRELGRDVVVSHVHSMLQATAIASKHPGFAEEEEWRIFFRPSENESPATVRAVEVIGGVPQVVYKLALGDDPARGLHGASIPSLLDRIIVGPTEYPVTTAKAFHITLDEIGVSDVEQKVVVSDIPLRTG